MPTSPAPFGFLEPLHVVGHGSWGESGIAGTMALHFMVPIDKARAVLISVDPDGNHMRSDPHTKMPLILWGRILATSYFGSGPLIFVDLQHTDGCYYGMDFPVPAGRFKSIQNLIGATCDVLRRPCPGFIDLSSLLSDLSAEEQPPGEQIASDRMEPAVDSGVLNTPTCEINSPISPRAHAVTPIFTKRRIEWGMETYIRVDREGLFHTYPHVGGPFQSMDQANDAIDCYLQGRRVDSMCVEKAGVSKVEMVIRKCVFWPDGTRKRRTKSHVLAKARDQMSKLVNAVVDQYNEDHNLVGDFAYKLEDMMEHEQFCENKTWYLHLNFVAKAKVTDDDDDEDDDAEDYWVAKQFFAELKETKQEGINTEWVVSCFCVVEPLDNGPCYACMSDIKHPNKADAYTGGHMRPDVLGGLPPIWSDSEEEEDAKERRIRRSYEDQEPFERPWYCTPKVKKTCRTFD